MMRLTRTGQLFLAAAVLLYLASLTSQSGLLLFLIGIIGGCYLVNAAAAQRSLRHVRVECPRAVHLSEGQSMNQAWRVYNSGRSDVMMLEAWSPQGLLFRLRQLAARSDSAIKPDLVYWKRGVYPNGRIRFASLFPFGLVRAFRSCALAGEVIVYPAVYPAAPPRAAGYDVMVGGKFKGQRRSAAGAEFAGVRPIEPGDPLKQIHWKSSAKGLGLMVKHFEEELSGRVALLFAPGGASEEQLDDAVRAAGSLVFAALDGGHHVEWLGPEDAVARVIPPFTDGQEILEMLARIPPHPAPITPETLQAMFERVNKKSALAVVLTEANEAIGETVRRWQAQGRTTSVYFPARLAEAAGKLPAPAFTYAERVIIEQS